MTDDGKQLDHNTQSKTGVSGSSSNGQGDPDAPDTEATSSPHEGSEPGERVSAPLEAPAWEAELDTYPLRPPSEDPRWAVRTIGCWVVFALASLVFILVLLVLGFIYD